MYLVSIMDWHSRRVLSWRVSNTLDTDFCIEALEEALQRFGTPEIFNTDQGSQFTSEAFTGVLKDCVAGHQHQHGWQGSVGGQRVRRAPVAQRQVRGCVPARLRNANRTPSGVGPVLRVLQRQAPTQRAGPTHPGCGVLWPGRPRIGSLKTEEDFTYGTVQVCGSISTFRNTRPHSTGLRDQEEYSALEHRSK